MLATGTILFEPTIRATDVMAHTCAVGNPARSSSFVSAAPQRVLVPQVDVRMTPETPADLSFVAIPSPIFLQFPTMLAHPDVL